MGIEQAPTEKGRQAARGLRKSAAADEKRVEAQKGSDLAKVQIALRNARKVPTARAREKSRAFERQFDVYQESPALELIADRRSNE